MMPPQLRFVAADAPEGALSPPPEEAGAEGEARQCGRPPAQSWRPVLERALVLAALLVAGVLLRGWIVANPALGHDSDLGLFTHWATQLADAGLRDFYARVAFCDYPPLGVLLLAALGHIAAWMGSAGDEVVLRVLLKVAACAGDLLIAVLVAREARRLIGRAAAPVAFGLFFLNPVVLYDSAYWGQVDSLFTAAIVLSLGFAGRRRWGGAGAAIAAGLLLKFQTIALAPLVVLEAYRVGGWRALGGLAVGAVLCGAVVLAPFAWTGTLATVLTRSYVGVVGQYDEVSKGAYNLWPLITHADTSDTGVPPAVARIAAGGAAEIAAGDSWLLHLTWRRISLVLYALAVAVVLSLYSRRPDALTRWGAAGALSLAFFLFPTEMHERYVYPAMALLVVWAVSRAWRERIYFALVILVLLNLAAILDPQPLYLQIGGGLLVVFALLVGALTRRAGQAADEAPTIAPAEAAGLSVDGSAAAERPLLRWFRRGTAAGVMLAVVAGGGLAVAAVRAPATAFEEGHLPLSALRPLRASQAWGGLRPDVGVRGGAIRLGDRFYLSGLGTHAPARIEYAVPADAEAFVALVGIDASAHGGGTAQVFVEVDGRRVQMTPVLRGDAEPHALRVEVRGAQRLTLVVDPTADGRRADHVSLALARFELGGMYQGGVPAPHSDGSGPGDAAASQPAADGETR